MNPDYWLQQKDKPLFEDLIWSRPENKMHAGKLLIVGGNVHGFSAPAEAYEESVKAGIGTTRVLLPDALQKTLGQFFHAGEYAPSTPSGSFAVRALAELLDMSLWADAVLLADNFGKNSETAILFEKYSEKYDGPLALTGDSLDYFLDKPELLDRENTLISSTFQQLQKIAVSAKFTQAFTSEAGLLKITELAHEFTSRHKALLVFPYDETFVVAYKGKAVTTKGVDASDTKIAAHAAVWWLQNLSRPLEACASAIYSIK